jgi:hypothetical protein
MEFSLIFFPFFGEVAIGDDRVLCVRVFRSGCFPFGGSISLGASQYSGVSRGLPCDSGRRLRPGGPRAPPPPCVSQLAAARAPAAGAAGSGISLSFP